MVGLGGVQFCSISLYTMRLVGRLCDPKGPVDLLHVNGLSTKPTKGLTFLGANSSPCMTWHVKALPFG